MGTKALITVEQFAQMHTPDTEDYELVEGELIPLSSATPRHAKIRGRDTVRRPDVSIFLGERAQQIDIDKSPTPFPPDIAIEVLSPSESAVDLRRKVRDYLRAGTQEVWLLDPSNREITVHTNTVIHILQATDYLQSPLLPGFQALVSGLSVNS